MLPPPSLYTRDKDRTREAEREEKRSQGRVWEWVVFVEGFGLMGLCRLTCDKSSISGNEMRIRMMVMIDFIISQDTSKA